MSTAHVYMGMHLQQPDMTGNPNPYDDRDDDSGQFRRKFDDLDYLRALVEHPVASTSDVAKEVGCAKRTAYKALSRLAGEDDDHPVTPPLVAKYRIGPSVAWTLTEEGASEVSSQGDGVTVESIEDVERRALDDGFGDSNAEDADNYSESNSTRRGTDGGTD